MNLTAVILLAGCLAGCGSLRVDISVLDPTVVEREGDRLVLRQRLPIALAEDAGSISRDVGTIQTSHFQAYVKIAEAYEREAESKEGQEADELRQLASDLQDAFTSAFKPAYEQLKADLVAQNQQIRDLAAKPANATTDTPGAALGTRDAALVLLLNQYQGSKVRLEQLFFSDTASLTAARQRLTDRLKGAARVATDSSKSKEGTARAAARSILAGQTLVRDSPYLYAIASADDDYWARKFNTVSGVGRLGNVDVAIKLDEDTQEFSLKGLTFDPSDVARAISKAGTQALVLTAQMLGAPVTRAGQAGSTETGTALATRSRDLDAAEQSARKAEAVIQGNTAALAAIAASILETSAEWASKTDDVRKQGIAAVRAIYNAQKALIQGSASTANTGDDGN